LRNRLHLLFEPAPEVLPDGARAEQAAQSLNLSSAAELTTLTREHQATVRAFVARWFAKAGA
ncbi:MAG: hypothetical protein NZ556_08380, partial [Fimbriimonadales bacterium]|nr:hypothetical protein [Fimbriimonadales bacterium]